MPLDYKSGTNKNAVAAREDPPPRQRFSSTWCRLQGLQCSQIHISEAFSTHRAQTVTRPGVFRNRHVRPL